MERELLIAAQYGRVADVKALLGRGCPVEGPKSVARTDQNVHLDTALHLACFGGHLDVARLLLEARLDVNYQNLQGFTLLHYASKRGHSALSELLLQHGALVNVPTPNTLQTPLHRAAAARHQDAVNVLLAHQADTTSHNHEGRTPSEDAWLASVALAQKARRGKVRTEEAARVAVVAEQLKQVEEAAYLLPCAQRLAWAKVMRCCTSPAFILSEDLVETIATHDPRAAAEPHVVQHYTRSSLRSEPSIVFLDRIQMEPTSEGES